MVAAWLLLGAIDAKATSLKSAYDGLRSSWASRSFVFVCGPNTFKIDRDLFRQISLYRKRGLEWSELEIVNENEIGITFRGSGMPKGIPISYFEERFGRRRLESGTLSHTSASFLQNLTSYQFRCLSISMQVS